MSGFNMMGLMNEKSKKTGEKQKYEMRTINIGQIIENPANSKIYTTEDIGRLADSIEMAGRVLQNLVVKPADKNGKYMLISGHRRLKACNHLVSRGKLEFGNVQCLIENEEDEDLQELMLIYTNSTARDMNDAEKARQAERATAILTKMKQEKKLEGRVRDIAANMLKTTSGQLARYHAIMNNLKDEELQRAFNSGKIGVSVAYEASGLSEEGQHKIALQMRDGSVTLQDVTIKKMEERAADDPEWKERMERIQRHRETEQEQERENEGENIERREMLVLPKSSKVEVTMITKKTDRGYETDVDYDVKKGDLACGERTVGVFKTIPEARVATAKVAAECNKNVAEALLKAGYIKEMPERFTSQKESVDNAEEKGKGFKTIKLDIPKSSGVSAEIYISGEKGEFYGGYTVCEGTGGRAEYPEPGTDSPFDTKEDAFRAEINEIADFSPRVRKALQRASYAVVLDDIKWQEHQKKAWIKGNKGYWQFCGHPGMKLAITAKIEPNTSIQGKLVITCAAQESGHEMQRYEILREDFDCERDALNAAVRHVAGKNHKYADILEWYTGDRVMVEDKRQGDKERTMRAAACIIGFLQKKIEEVQEELDDAKRMENEEGEANYTEVIEQLELMIEGKKIELENIM